jgi:hypothetical protein
MILKLKKKVPNKPTGKTLILKKKPPHKPKKRGSKYA